MFFLEKDYFTNKISLPIFGAFVKINNVFLFCEVICFVWTPCPERKRKGRVLISVLQNSYFFKETLTA